MSNRIDEGSQELEKMLLMVEMAAIGSRRWKKRSTWGWQFHMRCGLRNLIVKPSKELMTALIPCRSHSYLIPRILLGFDLFWHQEIYKVATHFGAKPRC
jgi:hypothetical protein